MQSHTLRQWQEAQGWTQEQAAHYLGTTKASVYRWEAARHPIPTCIALLVHLLTSERNKRSVERFLYAARDR
jgi:transcriptional regulator with XRE-family HTH domain